MELRPALFPARLTQPDGTVHDPVRVATDTTGMTRAWAWDHVADAAVIVGEWAAAEMVPDEGPTRRPRGFTLPDGGRLDQGKGCGCGAPIKRWRPTLVAGVFA